MRTRRGAVALTATLLLAGACSSSRATDVRGTAPRDLVLIDSGAGVTAVRTPDGPIAFRGAATLAMPGRSDLLTTVRRGEATILSELDPSSGAVTSSVRLDGNLALAVVSSDGGMAALLPTTSQSSGPWTPVPRSSTEVRVVETSGGLPPHEYRLQGNFQPEAFSADASTLFLLRYLPPTDPRAYRVASLDLATGNVDDVFGRDKTVPPETMSGTRISQVLAPSGDRLYTLYSSQPAEYAPADNAREYSGGGWGGEASGNPVAFVHTLSLRQHWAFCADLPRAFGSGPVDAKTIALSPDERWLYAIDAVHELVAVLDTRSMRVAREAHVNLGGVGGGPVFARVSDDGRTLFVAGAGTIVPVDTSRLAASSPWPVEGTVLALTVSAATGDLYAAVAGRVEVLDSAGGRVAATVTVPGLRDAVAIQALGS
jgi:hypothetical protein